jgi:hypothetical protein
MSLAKMFLLTAINFFPFAIRLCLIEKKNPVLAMPERDQIFCVRAKPGEQEKTT